MTTPDQNTVDLQKAAHDSVAELSTEALIGRLAQIHANVQYKTITPELLTALLAAKAEREEEIAQFRIDKLKETKYSLQLVGDRLRLKPNKVLRVDDD